jgi:hypothetical protein
VNAPFRSTVDFGPASGRLHGSGNRAPDWREWLPPRPSRAAALTIAAVFDLGGVEGVEGSFEERSSFRSGVREQGRSPSIPSSFDSLPVLFRSPPPRSRCAAATPLERGAWRSIACAIATGTNRRPIELGREDDREEAASGSDDRAGARVLGEHRREASFIRRRGILLPTSSVPKASARTTTQLKSSRPASFVAASTARHQK